MVSTKGPIHFIGIGGIGMSGIARILLQMGVEVSGSDLKETDTTKNLAALGARIFTGHYQQNIRENLGAVVYSSAVTQDNPEMLEARRLGIKIMPRAAMLAEIMVLQESIAVAGAHGKTTTTGMISLMLEANGMDPTIVIGGELKQIGSNAKLGKGKYLVAEADESDGSFLQLNPRMAVITNIENDHLDYYRSVENIVMAFYQFVKQIPEEGFVVVCGDNQALMGIKKQVKAHYITYGLISPEAEYTAKNIVYSGITSTSEIYHKGIKLGALKLNVPGEHNVLNALAAIALGLKLGLAFEQVVEGLSRFTGVKRRFELIDQIDGVTVVDDYAHHPTEIKATLRAAKGADYQRVIGVFQPHRYSRTQLLQFEFADSFPDADIVVINEIYSASEKPIPGVTAHLIVNAIRANDQNKKIQYCATEDDVVNYLKSEVKAGDIVLTMGAGNIRQAGIRLAREMKK